MKDFKEFISEDENEGIFVEVTKKLAEDIANQIGFDGDMSEFFMGLEVEQEHMKEPFAVLDVDDMVGAGKIAAIHLTEDKQYYTKLKSLNL